MKANHRTMHGALRAVKRLLHPAEHSYAPGSGGPNGIIPAEWAGLDGHEIHIGRGDAPAHTVLTDLDEANEWIGGRR